MKPIQKIAEMVVAYASMQQLEFTHLQLQKVLYYLQGWSAAFCPEPLFEDEPQAWVNGPVYTTIWSVYKAKGAENLAKHAVTEQEFEKIFQSLDFNEAQADVIKSVLEKYAIAPAAWLVYTSHNEKPWLEARKDLKPFEPSQNIISLDSIVSYFKGRLAQAS